LNPLKTDFLLNYI